MRVLETDGYEIHSALFTSEEIESFREEVDRVAAAQVSGCVRFLMARSAMLTALALDPRLLRLMPAAFLPVRSHLFDKRADQNWLVRWHQDLTIAVNDIVEVPGYGPWSRKEGVPHVQPPQEVMRGMVTIRIHLDGATAESGALVICPGSHNRGGRISQDEIQTLTREAESTCECQAGDVLVMSPLLLHASKRSRSAGRRRVVHFEYANPESLDPRLTWHEIRRPRRQTAAV